MTTTGQVSVALEKIGYRIISGAYPENEALPIEPELVAELGVSRNSLREAIKVLGGKGLLVSTRRKGTFVTPKGDWNLLDPEVLGWYAHIQPLPQDLMTDLIEMRQIIEPQAASLAARRASRDDVARIMSAYSKMEAAEPNSANYIDADIAFHTSILQATNNMIMVPFQHALKVLLRISFEALEQEAPDKSAQNLKRHRQLAVAIAAGDTDKAFKVAETLLSHTADICNEHMQ